MPRPPTTELLPLVKLVDARRAYVARCQYGPPIAAPYRDWVNWNNWRIERLAAFDEVIQTAKLIHRKQRSKRNEHDDCTEPT